MDKILTPKQRSAIERTIRNPDLQQILFRKAIGIHWFSAFKDAGYLNAANIPAPVPAKQEGYVSIPVWPITDYLVATSHELKQPGNEPHAVEFIEFIRAATKYAQEHSHGNYRVWWQFSKIIQNIPPHLITIDDISLVDYWLDDLYERGLVAENIGEKWLVALLERGDDHCKSIAASVLEILYKINIIERKRGSTNIKEAVLRFDSWYAKKITKKIAPIAGSVLGQAAVELFRKRLEYVLCELRNDSWSSLWRPAIADDGQNRTADDADDILVEALRDVLLSYIESAPQSAGEYVRILLENQYNTINRIAIHVVDNRYDTLKQLTESVTISDYLASNYRHEIWHFLHNHYQDFSDVQKEHIKKIITDIAEFDDDNQLKPAATAYRQVTWLSAIKDYGEDVAEAHKRLAAIAGGEPEHPDFSSYTSVGWVDHESPIAKEELLALNIEDLVRQLDSYEDPGHFGGPGIRGLTKVFRQTIKAEPLKYSNQLHKFILLDLAYIYEVIEAYAELWAEKTQLPWDEIWSNILIFCESLVSQKRFWSRENAKPRSAFVATRHWIVGSIGRLIENGTKSDDHAFPEKYLDVAEKILLVVLKKQRGEKFKPESDAVSIAINSPRGRCLESLINLTLRSCRLSDKQNGDHGQVWLHFQPIFDVELNRTEKKEYEFSTLVVNYLPNFLYMSKAWVLKNLTCLFDMANYQKWLCAMQGYAYVGHVYETIYKYLRDQGHFIRALDDKNIRERINEKIIQNIGVAFLNDFERLDESSCLINVLIERRDPQELSHLIWFLWTLRREGDDDLKAKIFTLWRKLVENIDTSTKEGRQLASKLCDWTVFVDEVDSSSKSLILSVVPYVDESHHTYDLLRSIARFSKNQPLEAVEIWSQLLEAAQPDYPEEAIKEALENLVARGNDGIRMAKDIASKYLAKGNETPFNILKKLTDVF